MGFDSIFFISCFLPVALLLQLPAGRTGLKNAALLALSLLFYLFSGLSALLLLLGLWLVDYVCGRLLARRPRKWLLAIGVAVNIGVLCTFKYLDFFAVQLLGIQPLMVDLVVPLGISFFTFKSISYLVDTYRSRENAAQKPWQLLLYISFFPQIVTGPITRFPDFSSQLYSRSTDLTQLSAGMRRFVIGLGKKLLIAGALGRLVDPIFSLQTGLMDGRLAWLGAVGYSLQLYFDFSGCTDMAIGLGRSFGFTTMENFNSPYLARSIGGFWRRWHISLSTWFRDYVYIPLGGNRKGTLRAGLNKTAVFFLCGLWHGANWTFLIWGAWHGLFSLLESVGLIPAKRLEKSRVLGRIYCLLVVVLGFVMFRAATPEQGFGILAAMFTGGTVTTQGTVLLHRVLTGQAIAALAVAVVLCLPWRQWLTGAPRLERVVRGLSYPAVLVLLVLCLIAMAAGDFAPAIYARF